MNTLSKKNIGFKADYGCNFIHDSSLNYTTEDAIHILEAFNVNVNENRERFQFILVDIVKVLNNPNYNISFHDSHGCTYNHSSFELSYDIYNGSQTFIKSYIMSGTNNYKNKKAYIDRYEKEPIDNFPNVPNVEIFIIDAINGKNVIWKFSVFTNELRYSIYTCDDEKEIESGYIDSKGFPYRLEYNGARNRK